MAFLNDAQVLTDIMVKEGQNTRSIHDQTFGKPMKNLSPEDIRDIISDLTESAFAGELKGAGENGGFVTNGGLDYGMKAELVTKLKDIYVQAAENAIFKNSQSIGNYISELRSPDQLHLVALIAGVIQNSYNVIFKTFVTKDIQFTRQVEQPFAVSFDNEYIDFFDLVNSKVNLEKFMGANMPSGVVELDFTAGAIDKNLIDEFNAALQASDPDAPFINGPYNFLNRGISVVSVTWDGGSGAKKYPVNYIATGSFTQSGQVSNVVGVIDLELNKPDRSKKVKVLGSVLLDGTVQLHTPDTNLKKIELKFNLPALGPQRPVTFGNRTVPIVIPITKGTAAQTTLNETFLQESALILGKDLIETFHKHSMQAVNAYRDVAGFDFIDGIIAELESNKKLGNDNLINYGTTVSQRSIYATEKVDGNIAKYGFQKSFSGYNDILAKGMHDVANELEVGLNPQERRFTIYSSSSAAQWIKQSDGSDFHRFGEIGDVADGTVANLSLPYSLKKIRIGGYYEAFYIASNRLHSKHDAEVDVMVNGVAKKLKTKEHRYVMLPRFEEVQDNYLCLLGPEYIEEGTGTSTYSRNKSLNLETKFDYAALNKSLGVVTYVEEPLHAV